MIPLAGYVVLFLAVGIGFVFVHLLAGKLIRPSKPDAEKGTIYECGEPTVGSAWVQFDLRFYVVALLFVIFDVEVAFFFPWAEVFGKANAIATAEKPESAAQYRDFARKVQELSAPPTSAPVRTTKGDETRFVPRSDIARYEKITGRTAGGKEARDASGKAVQPLDDAELEALRERQAAPLREGEVRDVQNKAWWIAALALIEVLVFFGVLLVGFAYLWRRGDLQWVRSTAAERPEAPSAPAVPAGAPTPLPRETVGAGGLH